MSQKLKKLFIKENLDKVFYKIILPKFKKIITHQLI